MKGFVQPAEPLFELPPQLGIERAERLVEQRHPRLYGDRAGNAALRRRLRESWYGWRPASISSWSKFRWWTRVLDSARILFGSMVPSS